MSGAIEQFPIPYGISIVDLLREGICFLDTITGNFCEDFSFIVAHFAEKTLKDA